MNDGIVLVTGATGFIGRHLAERLLACGYTLRLLVRDEKRLSPVLRAQCDIQSGSLQDVQTLMRAVTGVSVIYHCAANVSTWDAWGAYYSANVTGVQHLLQAVEQACPRLSRLVHLSTVDVYGFPERACDEQAITRGAGFPYGETKLLGENLVREFGRRAGISYTIIRPANVIGPRSQFIERIGAELQSGLMVTISGGRTNAGLIYIDNLIDSLVWAGTAAAAHQQCYNARDAYDVDWLTFLNALRQGVCGKGLIIDLPFTVADLTARAFEAAHRVFFPAREPLLHRLLVRFFGRTCGHNALKLHTDAGKPRIGFEEAVQRSCQWFLTRTP
ncbi:MAG: NAD-dependent epimerase/dehydratase family protein [Burkholderiales bacterium]